MAARHAGRNLYDTQPRVAGGARRGLGLGYAPIFVALVVYAQFMSTRSIVAGSTASIVPRWTPREAWECRRAGSSLRVEFPQALPVVIGGVRIASIAMISIATLGGYVGGVGLGVLIFNGLDVASAANDRGRGHRCLRRSRSPSMQRCAWQRQKPELAANEEVNAEPFRPRRARPMAAGNRRLQPAAPRPHR